MKIFFLYINISFLICIEYAIIYDDNLAIQANAIKNLYNNEVNEQFKLNTETYSYSSIYSSYTGDAISQKIRHFIEDLKNQNPSFGYLLILGDEITFPAFEIADSPSDDYFDDYQNGISISMGRIPSNNPVLVQQFVTKLSNFILNPKEGAWRNNALLISDDEIKNGSDPGCEIRHTINSDKIYDLLHPFMNTKLLYGVEYEAIMTGDGLYHQELNENIINEINKGVGLINYIGHGDSKKLSAEKILHIDDISKINTDNKIGLWVVGTCSFGHYDNDNCMAENLILDEDAAIAIISTVRSISEQYNSVFLEELFSQYSQHFKSSDIIRIGDILKNSKNNSTNSSQKYRFHLFGDPALPIFSSKQEIYNDFPSNITIVEQQVIENSEYDIGTLNIKFTDYETTEIEYGECNGDGDNGALSYTKPGNTLFEADFSETSCYRIPLDAINCNNCDIIMRLHYQDNNTYSGTSYVSENILLVDDYYESSEQIGPNINFTFQDSLIVDNTIIPKNSKIKVIIEDKSGINLYDGIGGNSINYWFNNEYDNRYIINSNDFIYTNSCSGEGYIEMTLPSIYNNQNTLHFEARDNYNNPTISSIILNISNNNYNQLIFDKFINFPNPFSNHTYFTYQVPNSTHLPININLNIFDLNGILLKKITSTGTNKFNSVFWDGKDEDGNQLPNNSYIININALSNNGQTQNYSYIISKIK